MGFANRKPRSRLGQPVQPTVKSAALPASVGGINALDSLMMMPPEDCLYTFNLMPVEYGLRLRRGYREWTTGLNGDVRTIIPYESASEDASKDRLFAVTEFGIYNVTTSSGAVATLMVTEGEDQIINEDGTDDIITEGGSPPVLEYSFASQVSPAGYGVYTEWTNDASNHYLFYADGINGLLQYTEAAGWAVPTGWTYNPTGSLVIPFPVEDIAFIVAHKLRLWVILEDSDDAYYSPIASVAGEFKKFTFGAKMPRGGFLVGLFTWSLDGGNGIDDFLVGISRGGDVLIYKGSDPELPDWTQVGSWFVGETTRSRRLCIDQGSDMYILSTYGITSLRDLLQGTVANVNRTSPSGKINRFLRADIEAGKDRHDWQLSAYPGDGFIQVVTPAPTNTPYIQYNQNTSTRAWGFWEGVPFHCADTWNGEYFMGGTNGTVYIYDGVLDGTTLDGGIGQPVKFRTLTSFQAPNNEQSTFKRCGLIRTMGVLAGTASISVKPIFDYNIGTVLPTPPPLNNAGTNTWNSAIWDEALWDFGINGRSYPVATLGMGRVMAVGLSGSAANRINVVGWDVMYTEGGLL